MPPDQARMWGEVRRDRTPIVTGGAVVVLTLSPDEVAIVGPDCVIGIHALIATRETRGGCA